MRAKVLTLSILVASTACAGCNAVLGLEELPPTAADAAMDSTLDGADSVAADATTDIAAETQADSAAADTTDGAAADAAADVIDADAADTGAKADSTLDTGAATDTAVADTAVADTTVAETAVADTTVADTKIADTAVADTTVADTTVADTTVADTTVADTAVADTAVADTAGADAGCDPTVPKWTKTFGTSANESMTLGNAFARANDGNYLVVGGSGATGYVVKFDGTGGKVWEKFPTQGFNAVIPVTGGLVGCASVAAGTFGCTAGRSCGACTRMDETGGVTWTKSWTDTKNDLIPFYAMAPTPAGGFAVSGSTTLGDPYLDSLLRTYDLSGTELMAKTYPHSMADELWTLQLGPDNTYYAAGQTGEWGSCTKALVMHIDAAGTTKGEYAIGPCVPSTGGALYHGYALQVVGTGSVVVAGMQYINATQRYDAFLSRIDNLDTTPTETWHRTFGGTGEDDFLGLVQLADGGFLAVGTKSTGLFSDKIGDLWVVRTNADGTLKWQKTFGGAAHDEGMGVLKAADGTYLIAGNTSSSGAGGSDLWVLDLPSCL